ncbi:MAG: branched-chain amino acid aminotransferase [Bernardetiaceae bacterium]|nr:branched-chain amino acid aminotransferase [Bernardetiaceae bacterium]
MVKDVPTTIEIDIQKIVSSRLASVDFNHIPFGTVYSDHMFVADYYDGQWQDLRIVPFQNMSVSPASSVLHYGQSVFEGMKAFRNSKTGKINLFRPDQNQKRINESAKRICIPEVPEEIFLEGLKQLIAIDREWVPKSEASALYIRPFIFAHEDFLGVRPAKCYRFMIFTCPVGAYYSEPVKVKIEKHFTRAATGGTGYAKAAGNYAGSLYPAKKAQEEGYHQLIWTDHKNHELIEESGTMNVMFVINNTLRTAPVSDTILDGITRKSVLQVAREWGINVEEKAVSVSELIQAIENGTLKEAFGVGTAATISHIISIGNDGNNYELPPIEKRELSHKLSKELSGLMRGHIPDTRNWIVSL